MIGDVAGGSKAMAPCSMVPPAATTGWPPGSATPTEKVSLPGCLPSLAVSHRD